LQGFAEALNQLRVELGDGRRPLSFRRLGDRIRFDPAFLSRVESKAQNPSVNLALALDREFATGGRFIELLLSATGYGNAREPAQWEAVEVIRGLNASDLSPRDIDGLHETVFELCCQYPYRLAGELRVDALWMMRHVARLRDRRLRLTEHRELLVAAGWLALLVACLEYDLGARISSDATRAAAVSLGRESGHSVIEAWGHEIAAWMALTQGRFEHTINHAQAGQAIESNASVAVQLAALEAKGWARLGDAAGVRQILDRSRAHLDQLGTPDRPDHHFVIDPGKWVFYAMDCMRQVGEDAQAAEYAEEVIRQHTALDGTPRAPMRVAEAHATLGVVAARHGDLDEAVRQAELTLAGERRSLPSLLLAADELAGEMRRRYPDADQVSAVGERIGTLRAEAHEL
jgi:hypothetical protein